MTVCLFLLPTVMMTVCQSYPFIVEVHYDLFLFIMDQIFTLPLYGFMSLFYSKFGPVIPTLISDFGIPVIILRTVIHIRNLQPHVIVSTTLKFTPIADLLFRDPRGLR